MQLRLVGDENLALEADDLGHTLDALDIERRRDDEALAQVFAQRASADDPSVAIVFPDERRMASSLAVRFSFVCARNDRIRTNSHRVEVGIGPDLGIGPDVPDELP